MALWFIFESSQSFFHNNVFLQKIAVTLECHAEIAVVDLIVMDIINLYLIWSQKTPLTTLCTNTFRKTDTYFGKLFGPMGNGFAVSTTKWFTAVFIMEVSDTLSEDFENRQSFIELYCPNDIYLPLLNYYIILGGVLTSRPWDAEWSSCWNGVCMVVTCEGMCFESKL